MPAINFKTQFADKVESGEKKQTIRPVRKKPIKAGDTLYLYTGMRTKNCRRLLVTECISIADIKIHENKARIEERDFFWSRHEECTSLNELANDDGFNSWPEMQEFFQKQYGLPFEGVLIRWT